MALEKSKKYPQAPGFTYPGALGRGVSALFLGQAQGYGHRDGRRLGLRKLDPLQGRRQAVFQAFCGAVRVTFGVPVIFPSRPMVKVSVISAGSFKPALAAS